MFVRTLSGALCLKPYGLESGYLAVVLLPAHPASFAHNFVSGMQSFYFS